MHKFVTSIPYIVPLSPQSTYPNLSLIIATSQSSQTNLLVLFNPNSLVSTPSRALPTIFKYRSVTDSYSTTDERNNHSYSRLLLLNKLIISKLLSSLSYSKVYAESYYCLINIRYIFYNLLLVIIN